jgi:hypothetical protein
LLGSAFCRDVPAAGLLALEVLGPRPFADRREALAWFQNLATIHHYTELARAERLRRARASADVE